VAWKAVGLGSAGDLHQYWYFGQERQLLIYALLIAKAGTVKAEGEPELVRAKRYGVQQGIRMIPFLVVILALMQEGRRHRQVQ
jgi:hypothetical protein